MIRKEFLLAVLLYVGMMSGIFYRERSHVQSLEYTAKVAKKLAFAAYFSSCMKSLDAFQVLEPGLKEYCTINALDFADETFPDEEVR